MFGKNKKEVPVVLQMEALECGAASLAMVLACYKKYIPLEKLRQDCGVSRDGSNAANILKAARHHGLKAKGYRYSVEKLKSLDTFPVIIHWNFNHFVVLAGFKGEKAVINDPASGRILVGMEEFNNSYTGIALVFRPSEQFKPSGKPKNVTGFLRARLKGYYDVIFVSMLTGLMLSFFGMVMPVFSKVFSDYILLDGSTQWMRYMLPVMGIVMLFMMLLQIFQYHVLNRAEEKMSVSLNSKFLLHVLSLPAVFFSQRSPGDISDRQMAQEEIARTLFEKVAPIGIHTIMIAIYFIILVYYSPTLAIVVACALGMQFALIRLVSKSSANINKNIMRDEGKYTGAAMAGISMIETIKASGCISGYFSRIVGYQTKYNNSKSRFASRSLFLGIVPEFISRICGGIILILGVNYILKGKFTIGLLLAFQGFYEEMKNPVAEWADASAGIQMMSGQMDRTEDVLNYKPDVDLFSDVKEISHLRGEIEMENVSFGYQPLSPPLIENFSIKIESGQMIAFVGGSGSGKSTIANLISGLYQVREGSITYDGKKREEINKYVYHDSLGCVNQNIVIFKDTIRNNLTLWDDTVKEEDIVRACEDACIYQDIMDRPDGFEYILSEGGTNLSGGQRQRLEIARELLHNPAILILDEATSALDPVTEERVLAAVRRRKITCIVIAHRLSTIRDADSIVVLKNGKEVERGTHEELVLGDGYYARLIRSE